jgi:plastocyanin
MTSLRVKISALAAVLFMLGATPGLAEDAKIKIANFTFDPPTLTVKAGTTVTWVNTDDIPHVVSEKNGAFRSGALDTDESFTPGIPDRRHRRIFLRDPSAHDRKDHRHAVNGG